MHELGLAQGIVEVVAARAARCHAVRVNGVRLRIGEAAGVVPDSLTFCFELLAREDPILAGAQLSIERVPHRGRCRPCGAEFDIVNFIMRCPSCGQWDADVLSGTELEVREMEYDADVAAGPRASSHAG